jgi:hypothetical protein
MLSYSTGSVADVTDGIILQQVNAQGIMGSGVAKALRDRYPAIWAAYPTRVKPHQHDQGRQYMGDVIPVQVTEALLVYNIVGQLHYGTGANPRTADGRYTSYDALSDGLRKVNLLIAGKGAKIHTVKLGCDRGRGEWPIVAALLEHHLRDHDVTVWELP